MPYWFNPGTQYGGGLSGASKAIAKNAIKQLAKGGDEAAAALKMLAKQADEFDLSDVKALMKEMDVSQVKQTEHLFESKFLNKLDPSDLKKLSDPRTLQRLNPSAVNKLDSSQLNNLAKFNKDMMKRMNADSLMKIDPDILKRADFDTLKKIDFDQFKQLDPDILKKLNLDETMLKRLNLDPSSVAKGADEAGELAESAAKSAAKSGEELTEQATKRVTNEINLIIKNGADDPSTFKAIGEETVESSKSAFRKVLGKHPRAKALGIVVSSIAVAALVDFLKKHNAVFNIINMEVKEEKDDVLDKAIKALSESEKKQVEIVITYQLAPDQPGALSKLGDLVGGADPDEDPVEEDPDKLIEQAEKEAAADKGNFEFATYDKIQLVSNDSQPMIPNKLYQIIEVDNEANKFTIRIDKLPTTLGKTGVFVYKTNFNNSWRGMAGDATEFVTKAAIDTTKGVIEGLGAAGGDAIGFDIKWIVLGIFIFIVLMVLGGLAFKFM